MVYRLARKAFWISICVVRIIGSMENMAVSNGGRDRRRFSSAAL